MKLRELMSQIVKPDGLWTQTVAEQKLGIPQWKLSNFKNASDDSEYEKNWQDFLRLLIFCAGHNIDPAQELKAPTDEEVLDEIKHHDKKNRGNAKGRKKSHEATAVGVVQKGRIAGGSGKTR
jgi:hypothetical protein